MNSLRAIQSKLKFLIETLQDFGNMPIFKRTFSQDLDLLEYHLTKEIISQTNCKTTLTKLITTFENAFSSEIKARMQNYTRYDAQSFYDAMIFNVDSLGKYMLELILHQQRTPQLLKQKKLMQTQEDHSNPIPALNVDSLKVDLVVIQNTCSEKEDESIRIDSTVQDDNSRSGNDTDADDADIRPLYDEETMAEVDSLQESYSTIAQATGFDSEPPHGSNVDIPQLHELQTNSSVFKPRSHSVQKVHHAAETVTTLNELDLLFGPLFG
ncbi:hypothetical protein Tco_0553164 [Tanacetum coccineum]